METEKTRDVDALTPLDARNSLLDHQRTPSVASEKRGHARTASDSSERYLGYAVSYGGGPPEVPGGHGPLTPLTPVYQSRDSLVRGAAPMGGDGREPTVPDVGYGGYEGYGRGY